MTYTPIPKGTPDWDVPVNAALTDQDARITTNTNSVNSLLTKGDISQGVYVPPNWGQFWRPKRNNASSVPAKIMTIGDSVTQGYYSSSLKDNAWPALLRQSVQALYGNGGSGMYPTSRTALAVSPSAPVTAQWEANGSFGLTTGAWVLNSLFFGPGITFLRTTAAATLTMKVTGTILRLWYISGGAPRANWTYQVDGGAVVPVTAIVGATTIQRLDVTGLSPGEHTVVVSWNGVAGDVLDFIGMAGENTNGVIVDNLGRSGTRLSSQWANNSQLTLAWNGGASNPCDLAIISLGINDASQPDTSETWVAGMATLCQAIKGANNGATDFIFLYQHYGSFSAPTVYAQYSSRLKDLASNYNAAVINMWSLGRNSWDYWNSLGFWGDSNNAGPAGTNQVHPSDAGHAFIASQVTPIVLS